VEGLEEVTRTPRYHQILPEIASLEKQGRRIFGQCTRLPIEQVGEMRQWL
jgi:hypothetical protein